MSLGRCTQRLMQASGVPWQALPPFQPQSVLGVYMSSPQTFHKLRELTMSANCGLAHPASFRRADGLALTQ